MADKQNRVEMFRQRNEPLLKTGDSVDIKPGLAGTVLCRYTPQGKPDQVAYLVEPKRSVQAGA